MTAPLFIALLAIAVALVYLAIAIRTWANVHGTRVVVCPGTQSPAAVTIDAGHAMASAVWEHADLRVTSCSRWPDGQGCDQPCVGQIEDAPSDTLPRTIAARFFVAQRCAICAKPIEPPASFTPQPGFMQPGTRRVDTWDDVPPQDLPRAVAEWRPLCANCTLSESFRQTFPDRVTNRERRE